MNGKVFVNRLTGDEVQVETASPIGGVYYTPVGQRAPLEWMSLDTFGKMFDPN